MMRSSNWLISAWKPKLSEAIFEREGREGRDEMGTKIEQSWRARRGPQTVYVLAWPGHSRTFHLSLYQSGQTPVSSSRLQPEPSTLFHDVRQHFPYSACYYSARYQGRGGDDRGEIGDPIRGDPISPVRPLTLPFSSSTIAFSSSTSSRNSSFSSLSRSFVPRALANSWGRAADALYTELRRAFSSCFL